MGMGREPKKRMDTNSFRPLFDTTDDDTLESSPTLKTLAQRMGIDHVLASEKQEDESDQG